VSLVAVGARRRRLDVSVRLLLLGAGAVVMVTPFAYMLATSFKSHAFVFEVPPQFVPKEPTTRNYADAWSSNSFDRYFLNSLVVAAATTVCSVFLSSMMAYAFARFRFRFRSLLFGLLLVGLMVPTMMLIIPQFLLARSLSLLDSLPGLVVFYVGGTLALNTFLLRGFFEGIPREIEEAMIVDGASAWRRYRSLILPLSRPALATVAIFSFLASWDEFVWALTIINDPQKRTLPIAIALFQGEHQTSWGLVFAASVLAVAPVIAVFLAAQRHFVSGIASGAVKG
jgi:multiple sugar transport system permease protein